MKKKKYLINIKGYCSKEMLPDPFITGQEYCDIKLGYSYIEFTGTEEELDNYLIELYKDESNFKVIGVHEDNPELDEHYKQLFEHYNTKYLNR